MILLCISFFAGVITVLTPCVLPLLPVIVGGTLSKESFSRKKAIIVVCSLGISVLAFTFLLKVSTIFINVPEFFWKILSGTIIIIVGLVTIAPSLWENKLVARLTQKANAFLGIGFQKNNTVGYIVIGAALGPVFTTCSPTYFILLAAVLPVSLVLGSLYMVLYVVGLCLSLLMVVFLSATFLKRLGVLASPHNTFKKVVGILLVVVGVLIITGGDKKIETNMFSKKYYNPIILEQKLLSLYQPKQEIEYKDIGTKGNVIPEQASIETKVPIEKETVPSVSPKVAEAIEIPPYKEKRVAPEISTPDGFINTDGKALTLAELRGKKVVLVSFWTYSCINCKRTLPYLNDWYTKYKDQGLEIVSIHTPEFSFERVQKNVEDAAVLQKIKYPIVLDNDYSTWNAYGNQYWPRKYLIDVHGDIVYDHIGEGAYEETESYIRKALEEINKQ